MAPASKKAKKESAPKPSPGGGLKAFFGGAKPAAPAASDGAAPEDAPPPVGGSTSSPPTRGQESVKGTPAAETPATTEAPAPALAPTATAAPSTGGLTDAQKQRMEENRRKALERQQAKKQGDTPSKGKPGSPGASSSQQSPLKPLDPERRLKRSGSDITPEKGPSPLERRLSPVAPTMQQQRAAAPAVQQPAPEPACGDKFRSFGRVSWMQYNSLYAVRLGRLRGAALAQAQSLWSGEVSTTNFLPSINAKAASTGDTVIVGVSFKDMPSRSNIIEMYRNSNQCGSLPEEDRETQPNLVSDADTVWLEDSTARIQLELPNEQVSKLASGFVMAARGHTTSDGTFMAKSICLAQGFVSTPLPCPAASKPKDVTPGPYLALLSGLLIGAPDEDTQARSRAVEFLLGRCEGEGAVQRVVVCGDVFWRGKAEEIPPGLEDADNMFSELAKQLPIEVMPGHKDPSNWSLPQLPMHPYLFRSARKCSNFKSVSNPYQCTLGDLSILGHAGQPVRDLMRCTSIATPLQALKTCLDAYVVAPTAPDTLGTQPFDKADPFIMEAAPQVFFSGGHDQVEYEWCAPPNGSSGTLCVCVPAFHKHPSVVLVNLRDPRDVCVHEFSTKLA